MKDLLKFQPFGRSAIPKKFFRSAFFFILSVWPPENSTFILWKSEENSEIRVKIHYLKIGFFTRIKFFYRLWKKNQKQKDIFLIWFFLQAGTSSKKSPPVKFDHDWYLSRLQILSILLPDFSWNHLNQDFFLTPINLVIIRIRSYTPKNLKISINLSFSKIQ